MYNFLHLYILTQILIFPFEKFLLLKYCILNATKYFLLLMMNSYYCRRKRKNSENQESLNNLTDLENLAKKSKLILKDKSLNIISKFADIKP